MRSGSRTRRPLLGLGLTAVLASGVPAQPSDWPQFLGPSRDGRTTDRRLVAAWRERGLRERFRVPVGEGYSGLVTGAGRVFGQDADGRDEYVFALSADDGRELWRHRLGGSPRDVYGGTGPRTTPSVDAGRVIAVGALGRLVALRAEDGAVVWQRDLAELGWRPPAEGAAASPLVWRGRLFVVVGGDGGRALACLDPATGRTLWTGGEDRAAYASPVGWDGTGAAEVLLLGATRLVGLDASTGAWRWSHPWPTYDGVNAASPLPVGNGALFLSAGYDQGAVLFRVGAGAGAPAPREVWRSRVMKNHFNNSVHHEGTLYGFDEAILQAVDAATGELLWRRRGFGKGSLILAGEDLIVLSDDGELALVEPRRDAYAERARRAVLEGRTWTPPSLAAGRLLLRSRSEIVCLE